MEAAALGEALHDDTALHWCELVRLGARCAVPAVGDTVALAIDAFVQPLERGGLVTVAELLLEGRPDVLALQRLDRSPHVEEAPAVSDASIVERAALGVALDRSESIQNEGLLLRSAWAFRALRREIRCPSFKRKQERAASGVPLLHPHVKRGLAIVPRRGEGLRAVVRAVVRGASLGIVRRLCWARDVEVVENVDPEFLKSKIKDCDGVSIRTAKLTGDVIEAANNLKIISRHGVGYDNIDLEASKKNNLTLAITATANAVAVAEHVMFMLLSIDKQLTTHFLILTLIMVLMHLI